MPTQLFGKKVVITGANRGIGLGSAQGFLDAGAEVTIAALEEGVHQVAEDLSQDYGRQLGHETCDLADLGQVKAVCPSWVRTLVSMRSLSFMAARQGQRRRISPASPSRLIAGS